MKVKGTVRQIVAFAPNLEMLNLNHTDVEGPLPTGSGCDYLHEIRLTNSNVEAEQWQKEKFLQEFQTCRSLEINPPVEMDLRAWKLPEISISGNFLRI